MEREVKNDSRFCQIPQGLGTIGLSANTVRREIIVAAGLITVLSIAALSTYLLWAPPTPLQLSPHAPIEIDGDADFSATALLEGWPGDGSPETPYIIDGLQITRRGLGFNDEGSCILISNTRVSFTISNCEITEGGSHMIGELAVDILLDNVTNGLIVNNFFNSAFLGNSHYNTLANNICSGNGGNGIHLVGSDSNTVANNTCYNHGNGIVLGDPYWDFEGESENNTVINNTCYSNEFRGISLYDAHSNTVANNTCNDNDREDVSGSGICLWDSESNTVVNNTCNNNEIGILLGATHRITGQPYDEIPASWWEVRGGREVTHSNTVANNTCNNNTFGIYLHESDSNAVVNNTCLSNTDSGIELYYSDTSTLVNNTCLSNNIGIVLEWSDSNTVANTTCNNNRIGIYLTDSTANTVVSNSYFGNIEHDILVEFGNDIAIDGDANFSDTALLEGWPGDGSPGNPYIIDGLDIDLSSGSRSCIFINNTQVSFIIRNCKLIGAWVGIALNNVTNGELVNNILDGNCHGLLVGYSNNCGITDNTCNRNEWSIELYGSDSNTVVNNTCSNNRNGISLVNSKSNTVKDNTCNNNSIDGIRLLGECGHNTVVNNTCNNNEQGIVLYGSYYNTITKNTCNNNAMDGISLSDSESNTVVNNTCLSNDIGIVLERSDYNTVVNNTCNNNTMDGIFLGPVCWGDTCRSNEIGILLEWSYSNTVANNTCNSNDIGIYIHESDFNTVANNNCTDNRIGIYLEESYLNTGENNTFSGNTEHDMVDESELRELAHRENMAKQFVWFLAGCGMILVVSVVAFVQFRRMEM